MKSRSPRGSATRGRAAFVVGMTVMAGAPAPLPAAHASGDDAFADAVVSYDAGTNAVPGYTTPATALGPPTSFTGGAFDPMVVSVMNAPWRPDEIVSIGAGGHLVVRFDTPVTDDPHNPYGIDLLVFGNAFFDDGGLDGVLGDPAVLFGECGAIEVSADGVVWTAVPGVCADDLFPTEGFLDLATPYETSPGAVGAAFTKPVDPALATGAFDGLAYEEVLGLYRGSGGGAGVDLATLGLAEISFVRISAAPDATSTPEIDAVADVAPRRPGDATLDGVVDFNDLLEVLARWGPSRPHGWDADFDGDGVVGFADLLAVLGAWDGAP